MSKSESERPLSGWKQSSPSVWIRVRLGSRMGELPQRSPAEGAVCFLGEHSSASVDSHFHLSGLQWSLPKRGRMEDNLRMSCRP